MAMRTAIEPHPARGRKVLETETGLDVTVARRLAEVVEAWHLVYRSYRRAGLIPPNRWELHTLPHATQPDTVVVTGRIREQVVSTLSAYMDGPKGLPLDVMYPDELQALRNAGRRIVEFGLFADRRRNMKRSIGALLDLMRYVCYFGVTRGATDGVIGVHPRHVAFYERLLAFERIGEVRQYATMNDAEVVLLRLDWYAMVDQAYIPPGLRYWLDHPLTPDVYLDRPIFREDELADSPELTAYLQEHHRHGQPVAGT